MQMFEVGGCVRDEILGIPSKDIDFTVVLDGSDMRNCFGPAYQPFDRMVELLEREGFKIFLKTPQFLTVRAQFPKGDHRSPLTADFVLARKESSYTDGRRPDVVEVGKLGDDLRRRDFTMNAIAKETNGGTFIDPHNGIRDIQRRIIRAVGDPLERLTEDPLRALRAIRFMVTKGFALDMNLASALREPSVHVGVENVADERITDEFSKMFRHDTVASVLTLNLFPGLMAAAFSGRVSLDATMKQKGRG